MPKMTYLWYAEYISFKQGSRLKQTRFYKPNKSETTVWILRSSYLAGGWAQAEEIQVVGNEDQSFRENELGNYIYS